MKLFHSILFVGSFLVISSVSFAIEKADGIMAPQTECCSGSEDLITKSTLEKMDMQLKTMKDIHEKLLMAKNDKERKKLMPEHLRVMQESLVLMKNLPVMDNAKMANAMKMMGDGKAMDGMEKNEEIKGMKSEEKSEKLKHKKAGVGDMRNDENHMEMRMNMMGDMMKGMNSCRMMMEKRMEMITAMLELTLDRVPGSFPK